MKFDKINDFVENYKNRINRKYINIRVILKNYSLVNYDKYIWKNMFIKIKLYNKKTDMEIFFNKINNFVKNYRNSKNTNYIRVILINYKIIDYVYYIGKNIQIKSKLYNKKIIVAIFFDKINNFVKNYKNINYIYIIVILTDFKIIDYVNYICKNILIKSKLYNKEIIIAKFFDKQFNFIIYIVNIYLLEYINIISNILNYEVRINVLNINNFITNKEYYNLKNFCIVYLLKNVIKYILLLIIYLMSISAKAVLDGKNTDIVLVKRCKFCNHEITDCITEIECESWLTNLEMLVINDNLVEARITWSTLNNKCEDNEIGIKQILDKAISNEFNVLLNESERIFCGIYILKKVKDGNLEITEDMLYSIRDYFVSKYQIKMLYDRMKELKHSERILVFNEFYKNIKEDINSWENIYENTDKSYYWIKYDYEDHDLLREMKFTKCKKCYFNCERFCEWKILYLEFYLRHRYPIEYINKVKPNRDEFVLFKVRLKYWYWIH